MTYIVAWEWMYLSFSQEMNYLKDRIERAYHDSWFLLVIETVNILERPKSFSPLIALPGSKYDPLRLRVKEYDLDSFEMVERYANRYECYDHGLFEGYQLRRWEDADTMDEVYFLGNSNVTQSDIEHAYEVVYGPFVMPQESRSDRPPQQGLREVRSQLRKWRKSVGRLDDGQTDLPLCATSHSVVQRPSDCCIGCGVKNELDNNFMCARCRDIENLMARVFS